MERFQALGQALGALANCNERLFQAIARSPVELELGLGAKNFFVELHAVGKGVGEHG